MFCTCMSDKDHSRNKRDGYCNTVTNVKNFFYNRYCYTDRRYAMWVDTDTKIYRVFIGKYGIKVIGKNKIHCFYFSPIPF